MNNMQRLNRKRREILKSITFVVTDHMQAISYLLVVEVALDAFGFQI